MATATPEFRLQAALRLGRALRLVWRSGRGWVAATCVLLVIQSVLPTVTLYLTKRLVDVVTAGRRAADLEAAFREVLVIVGLAAGVTLLDAVCRSIRTVVDESQALAVTDHVQELLHAKSIEADLAYYENSQYYDALQRAQSEAPYRPAHVVSALAQTGQSALSLVAMAGLLLALHWSVAVLLFLAAIPGLLGRIAYARHFYRWGRQQALPQRLAGYFHWLLTSGDYAKEVRLFELGATLGQRYRALRNEFRLGRLRLVSRRALTELAAQTGVALAGCGASALIAYRAVHGFVTLGDLVMYFGAFQRAQSLLQETLAGLGSLYEDNLFLASLDEFLALEPQVLDPTQPAPVPRPMRSGIRFHQVGFHYPGSSRSALDGVDLTVRPGEVIALVGANGSGKTTLIKLLCRFYDPNHGSITIDGIDVRRFQKGALRREISVIFQDFVRYQLTASDNIAFGSVHANPTSEQIVAAAERADVDAIIKALPRGYDTVLGRWYQDGEELSIGEWQKIALARAFLRDAQLIVLDEPTSALDPKAEEEIFHQFRQLIAGRSAILISHRLSSVKLADRIYVLAEGRIVESGSHEELCRRGKVYASLFEAQAQYYR